MAKETFQPDKRFVFLRRRSLVIVGREITDSLDNREIMSVSYSSDTQGHMQRHTYINIKTAISYQHAVW